MPNSSIDFGQDGVLLVYHIDGSAAYGTKNRLMLALYGNEITDACYAVGDYAEIGEVWNYPGYVTYLRTGTVSQFGIFTTYFAGQLGLNRGKIEFKADGEQFFSANTITVDDNVIFMRIISDK